MGKKNVVSGVQQMTAEPGDVVFVVYPPNTAKQIVDYTLTSIKKMVPKGVHVFGKPSDWKVILMRNPDAEIFVEGQAEKKKIDPKKMIADWAEEARF